MVGVLSDDTDPMVTVMKLEKAPTESYADIGGNSTKKIKSENNLTNDLDSYSLNPDPCILLNPDPIRLRIQTNIYYDKICKKFITGNFFPSNRLNVSLNPYKRRKFEQTLAQEGFHKSVA